MTPELTTDPVRFFSDFVLALRVRRGASERTVEQYGRHIWAFYTFLAPALMSMDGTLIDSQEVFMGGSDDPTVRSSRRATIQYLSWVCPFALEDVRIEDCNEFRLSLHQGGRSVKTCNAYMVTLRSFFKYARKEGIECLDPIMIDLVKQKQRQVTFLTPEEIIRLRDAIPSDTIQGVRDRAIFECIYSTGLRISELCALDRPHVDLMRGEFSVRGKGGRVRVVYLTDYAREVIATYTGMRDDDFAPLFIRHNTNPHAIDSYTVSQVRLSRIHITTMIKEYALRANIIKNVSAHTLRHSFATTLLTNGADIRSIQEMLGHASITTTQVYTHVTNPRLKDAHRKYHH